MKFVDKYGRVREELDDIRARVAINGAFTLYSADGVAMCGRQVPGYEIKKLTDPEWTSVNEH